MALPKRLKSCQDTNLRFGISHDPKQISAQRTQFDFGLGHVEETTTLAPYGIPRTCCDCVTVSSFTYSSIVPGFQEEDHKAPPASKTD